MAEPVNSMTCPVPPPVPISAQSAKMMSLAVTPGISWPSTRTSSVLALRCKRHCVASTCSTSLVPMPNASAPNAPCVEVWLSPHTMVLPGCVNPRSGPMTCTIPLRLSPSANSSTPNSLQLLSNCAS